MSLPPTRQVRPGQRDTGVDVGAEVDQADPGESVRVGVRVLGRHRALWDGGQAGFRSAVQPDDKAATEHLRVVVADQQALDIQFVGQPHQNVGVGWDVLRRQPAFALVKGGELAQAGFDHRADAQPGRQDVHQAAAGGPADVHRAFLAYGDDVQRGLAAAPVGAEIELDAQLRRQDVVGDAGQELLVAADGFRVKPLLGGFEDTGHKVLLLAAPLGSAHDAAHLVLAAGQDIAFRDQPLQATGQIRRVRLHLRQLGFLHGHLPCLPTGQRRSPLDDGPCIARFGALPR